MNPTSCTQYLPMTRTQLKRNALSALHGTFSTLPYHMHNYYLRILVGIKKHEKK